MLGNSTMLLNQSKKICLTFATLTLLPLINSCSGGGSSQIIMPPEN